MKTDPFGEFLDAIINRIAGRPSLIWHDKVLDEWKNDIKDYKEALEIGPIFGSNIYDSKSFNHITEDMMFAVNENWEDDGDE